MTAARIMIHMQVYICNNWVCFILNYSNVRNKEDYTNQSEIFNP